MESPAKELHFILFPLMAQGHMIPMVDIARILAQRGATVTIVTTPVNAKRYEHVISRAIEAKFQIQLLELQFPSSEAGLPEGCENLDMLPSADLTFKFFEATCMLQKPAEELLQGLEPKPSCIISDTCLPWTIDVAQRFCVPRLSFQGMACFSQLCIFNLISSQILESVKSDTELFVIPGLIDRFEVTKTKVAGVVASGKATSGFLRKLGEAERGSYGTVVNSFYDLELKYVSEFEKAKGKSAWCIGPVSLCNKDEVDKAQRGNKATIDEQSCLKWLDKWETNSVVYVNFGSLSRLATSQMIELGLGLEESNRPFIWCMGNKPKGLDRWLEEGFEERVKGRGLLVHGWAPQVLILSHRAVGGFLTHCGWNSTLEGISAGVPMLTWPLFGEQFFNEHFVVEMAKVGVRIGAEVPITVGEEEKIGVLVTKDEIKIGIGSLMDEGEGERRRQRARELGNLASKAMEEGGSSHLSITLLIQNIRDQVNSKPH